MFLSENIDLDNVERYNLSIRISPQNFSVLIQDSENAGSFDIQNTAFSSKSTLLANIQRIIFDNSFLTDNFRKVNVVIVSQMYEIIPKSFYEEKYAQKLYNFTHSNKGKHVLTSKLPNGNNRVLFEFDEEVYLFLMRSLYNPLFYHHSSILTEYFEKKSVSFDSNSLFIYFHEDYADVFCFNRLSDIIHMHTYHNENETNLSYFILNLWKNCNFDQYKDHLFIYGQAQSDKTEDILKEYIKNISKIGVTQQISDFGIEKQKIPMDLLILQE